MALKAPDMNDCTPKRRCLGGPNDGLAYAPGDECDAGFIFDPAKCDCEPTVSNTCDLYLIEWQVQSFGYSICGGDPNFGCDSAPSLTYREARIPPGYSAPYWKVTQTVNYDMGRSPFPGCPDAPDYQETGSYDVLTLYARDANGNEAAVRGTYQSLLQIYSPAYYNKTVGGGCTVYNYDIYEEGDITKLCELTSYPAGTCSFSNHPAGTECGNCPCPDGFTRDGVCECVPGYAAGTYRYDGTITNPDNSMTVVSETFTVSDGDQFGITSDAEVSTTFIADPNTFVNGNTSIIVTRSNVACTGGGVAFYVRVNYAAGGGIDYLVGSANINCAWPEGSQASISGTFTKTS